MLLFQGGGGDKNNIVLFRCLNQDKYNCEMFGIVFRHELFENTPWIPLAFLVHDRKLQKCHNRLFEFIAEKIPALKSRKIPFVMDREPALTRAVKTYFPNMQVLHCWNHLKRDFKEELRKLCADKSEISIYLSDWKQMAQSERDFEVAYTIKI